MSTCWPSPSRCSRCPTGTSACAATSTRATRTALPGTYLNSFYENRPLPYAEAGYGYPESGQTIVNVTNGKLIRLLVDDEPFDMRYGEIRHHERMLDLRRGMLRRTVEWASPSGRVVGCRSTRLVSFTQRAIVAIHYEVEAVDAPTRVVVQSELVANEEVPQHVEATRGWPPSLEHPLGPRSTAPAATAAMLHPPHPGQPAADGRRRWTTSSTVPTVPGRSHTYVQPDWARTTVGARLQPGETLRHHQVRRLRLVQPALHAGAARPGRRRPVGGAAHRLGRPGRRAARPTSTSSGTAPTSRSTATTRCSRRCGSGCSTCCRPAPGPSSGRSRPRG